MTNRSSIFHPTAQIAEQDAKRMASGGLNRRELLGALMAGGMSLAAAVSVLRTTPALAETPRKGGRIKVAGSSISPNDTLDPAKQSFSTDYARCSHVLQWPDRARRPA